MFSETGIFPAQKPQIGSIHNSVENHDKKKITLAAISRIPLLVNKKKF